MNIKPPQVKYGRRLDYVPFMPPANEEEKNLRAKAREVRSTADSVLRFLAEADHTDRDLDPRDGFVSVKDAPVPNLLGEESRFLTGTLAPLRYMNVRTERGSSLRTETKPDGSDSVLLKRTAVPSREYLNRVDYLATYSNPVTTYITGYTSAYPDAGPR